MDPGALYLDYVLRPFSDVLATINDVGAFENWAVAVNNMIGVPNANLEISKSNDLNRYKRDWFENFKADILMLIGDELELDRAEVPGLNLYQAGFDISPWEIAGVRDFSGALSSVLGEARDKLPVTITTNYGSFNYELTENFVAGLLISYNGNIDVSVNGIRLSKDFFRGKHAHIPLTTIGDILYSINIYGTDYEFTSPDFVQGIKTAAEWMDVDPHTIARNLKMQNVNTGEVTDLNFQ